MKIETVDMEMTCQMFQMSSLCMQYQCVDSSAIPPRTPTPQKTVFSHFLLDVLLQRSEPPFLLICGVLEICHTYPRGFDYPYSIFLSRNDLRILLSSTPKQRFLCRISGHFQGIEWIEACRWQATILIEKRVG